MKIYIAASDYYKALGLTTLIEENTPHKVISRWIKEPKSIRNMTTEQKSCKAKTNLVDVAAADIVILMDDYDTVPGGKFFDLATGYTLGKRCIVLGRRENMYMHLSEITQVNSLPGLIEVLKKRRTTSK